MIYLAMWSEAPGYYPAAAFNSRELAQTFVDAQPKDPFISWTIMEFEVDEQVGIEHPGLVQVDGMWRDPSPIAEWIDMERPKSA